MSDFTPDDNNPAADAAMSVGIIVLPFMAIVFGAIIVIGGVPLFGIDLGGSDHGADHGAEHAAEADHGGDAEH